MELDLQQYSVRTDLAVDAREMAAKQYPGSIPGVDEEVSDKDGIKVTRLNVLNDEGSQAIGRVKGHYVTISETWASIVRTI